MKYANMREGLIIFLALLMLVSFAGCAKPPTQEMSDARQALDDAAVAGAPDFAREQYMTAEEALNEANALMESKKYKDARKKAIEATSLARKAHAAAIENKNAMNVSAQEMYNRALEAVNAANDAGAYTYADQLMMDAQRALEESRNLYNAGDYASSQQRAEAALVKAREAEAAARQARAAEEARISQQARDIQDMTDPGATPRPYPTNHIVIKGESLWWIAEYKQIYNDPFQWPLIYKANRSKIKDPDLIYPGQDFRIMRTPELTEEMVKDAIRTAKNRGAWSLHDGK
jgi:nucleoid-associated protein YgaU